MDKIDNLTKKQITETRYQDIISSLSDEINTLLYSKSFGIKGIFTVIHLMRTRRHYVDILVKSIRDVEGVKKEHDLIQSN